MTMGFKALNDVGFADGWNGLQLYSESVSGFDACGAFPVAVDGLGFTNSKNACSFSLSLIKVASAALDSASFFENPVAWASGVPASVTCMVNCLA